MLDPYRRSTLLLQLGYSRAGATLILRRLIEFFHVGAGFQKFPDCLPQNTHAVSVHNADAAGRRHHGGVEKLFHAVASFFSMLADDIDLLKRRPQLRRRLERNVLWQLAG